MKQSLRKALWGTLKMLAIILVMLALKFPLAANNHPILNERSLSAPAFIDPVPNDTTVACVDDIPIAVDLRAEISPGDTMNISPVDSPDPASIDACAGGVITRTWLAIDMSDDSTMVSQTITVLPDTQAPIVSTTTSRMDTVACQVAFGPTTDPFAFPTWLNSKRLAVATSISDDCAGGLSVSDDAPNNPNAYNSPCNTLEITFTYSDACGNMDSLKFFYTTYDSIAPVLTNLPADTVMASCDAIPAPADVMVSDNCTDNLQAELTETSSQLMDGSCGQNNYTIVRTWNAVDSCGNAATPFTQYILVSDAAPPMFTLPSDITIGCNDDPLDLNLTGTVTDTVDNCSGAIQVSFSDNEFPGSCPFDRIIERQWIVRDVCGSAAGGLQMITVADNISPTFTVPADITVDCSEADELSITGEPTNLQDNCDPNPTLLPPVDLIIPSMDCVNSYTIERTWRAQDACGNFAILIQTITVVDNTAPQFQNAPQDLTLDCIEGIDVNTAFTDWTTNLAQAIATDNCTQAIDLQWLLLNSGTTDTVSLSMQNCGLGNQVILEQTVDFIVIDECDLRDTMTATFRVMDMNPPVISECPTSISVSTDPGLCSATVELMPPVIEDICALSTTMITANDSANLSSQAQPGEEGDTPVDPVSLSLVLAAPLPINAAADANLQISLTNADAEAVEEVFLVYGEDGSLIGQTGLSSSQCADSDTTLILPIAQVNSWAADGRIDLNLVANLPDGALGRVAINDICGGSSVSAEISFPVKDFTGIVFEYAIDGGSRTQLDPIEAFNVVFDQGNHMVTYYASDCAGNIDSCSFGLLVEDLEAPQLDCPADVVLAVPDTSCMVTYTLPLPVSATDNCGIFEDFNFILPPDTSAAFIQFDFDNNLGEYLARSKTFSFNSLAANVFGDVTLTLDFLGDFSTNEAFGELLGDDGSVLITTMVGDADCSNAGQTIITIPAATFNAWAADGIVNFEFIPNDITVPPGVAGDGINPCNPAVVNANGDTDGVSYLFVQLSYSSLTPSYFTTGALETPTTSFMAPALAPSLDLTQGETEVSYLVTDLAGNADTCSFTITVEDNTPPTAICQPTTLFINPSGAQIEVVDPATVDGGSFDNCALGPNPSGIDSMFLSPNTFDCLDAGMTPNVTLTVWDASGNSDQCTTIVGIQEALPEPTASSGLCGGDTLFLFANPPASTGGIVYTYRWTFNGSLISTEENPVIPGITSANEGAYEVEIRGITGCTSTGVTIVNIEDLPFAPTIEANTSLCVEEEIVLTTPDFPSGNNVVFRWYSGLPPNGTLIASTDTAELKIPGPHPLGDLNFYLTVEANGCESGPSDEIVVRPEVQPNALITTPDAILCEADSLMLLATSNDSNVEYEWTGPNSFSSTLQFPVVGPLTMANAGFYYLRTRRNGCYSEPDSVLLSVKPLPEQPTILSNSPICTGEDLVLQTPSSGASSYRWVGPNNDDGGTTAGPNFTVPNAGLEDGGGWTVFITRNGCESVESIPAIVNINPNPEASATATPDPVCNGDDVLLQGFSSLATVSYDWTGPMSFSAQGPNVQIGNVNEFNQGTYNLIVTAVPSGCSDTTEVLLDVRPAVEVTSISSDNPACSNIGDEVELCATALPVDPGNYIYEWTGPVDFNAMGACVTISDIDPTKSGNYTLVIRTIDGCESMVENFFLDLEFAPAQPAPPSVVSGDDSFCEGESMELITTNFVGEDVDYIWTTATGSQVNTQDVNMLVIDDLTSNDSGGYSVMVIRNGCASPQSPTRVITVNARPNVLASSNSPLCEGDDLVLDANLVSGANYSWGGPAGFNSGLPNPVQPEVDTSFSGRYFVVADINGCFGDTSFIDVVVKERPLPPILEAVDPICVDDPSSVLTLSISEMSQEDGAYWQWYVNNGNMPLGDTINQPDFSLAGFSFFTGDGPYDFFATTTVDGCTSDLSDAVTVELNDIPINAAFAGVDTTACSGEFILQGIEPERGIGQWSFVGASGSATIVNPGQANSIITGLSLEDSLYTLRWSLSNGACVDYDFDDVDILVSEGEAALAGDDFRICAGEELTLNAVEPTGNTSVGYWVQDSVQALFMIGIVDSLDANTAITGIRPDNVYSFTWVVESACGVNEDDVLVFVSDPDPDAGPDLISCNEDASIMLEGTAPLIGSAGLWSSPDPEIIFTDNTDAMTEVSNLVEGENILVWTLDAGICGEASRDTTIVEYKTPAEAITDVYNVPFNGSIEFNPLDNDLIPAGSTAIVETSGLSGRIEDLGDGRFLYTAPSNFIGEEETSYIIISDGCADVVAVIRFVTGDGVSCIIPNLFTPNDDGVNDAFVIPCLLDQVAYPRSQVSVYNKWGDEVFRSPTPYDNNWRGTYDGQPLPEDTYFYVVDLGDGSEAISGFVVIQR